jgi:hypothetical protein
MQNHPEIFDNLLTLEVMPCRVICIGAMKDSYLNDS